MHNRRPKAVWNHRLWERHQVVVKAPPFIDHPPVIYKSKMRRPIMRINSLIAVKLLHVTNSATLPRFCRLQLALFDDLPPPVPASCTSQSWPLETLFARRRRCLLSPPFLAVPPFSLSVDLRTSARIPLVSRPVSRVQAEYEQRILHRRSPAKECSKSIRPGPRGSAVYITEYWKRRKGNALHLYAVIS